MTPDLSNPNWYAQEQEKYLREKLGDELFEAFPAILTPMLQTLIALSFIFGIPSTSKNLNTYGIKIRLSG